jgi:hypothetical protein
MGFGLFDRGAEGVVVARAPDGAFNIVGRTADAPEDATEQVADGAHRASGQADTGGAEFREESVAAAIAEEFELITFVGGVVGVIAGELKQGHCASPNR